MDLIDRYLDTVRLLLPGGQRDDITAELRDLLMSRREEREATLGRPLTRKEDEALLRSFGNPVVVAARYGRQRYLIGPELYPLYMLVLKLVLAAVAFAAVVTGVVQAAVSPGDVSHAVGTMVDVLWSGAFSSIGAVTLAFAGLQRTGAGARILADWRVDELPRFNHRKRRTPAWFEHAAGIVVQALFLLWWTGVLPVWWAVIKAEPHGVLTLGLAPVWHVLYWPVIWRCRQAHRSLAHARQADQPRPRAPDAARRHGAAGRPAGLRRLGPRCAALVQRNRRSGQVGRQPRAGARHRRAGDAGRSMLFVAAIRRGHSRRTGGSGGRRRRRARRRTAPRRPQQPQRSAAAALRRPREVVTPRGSRAAPPATGPSAAITACASTSRLLRRYRPGRAELALTRPGRHRVIQVA